MICNVCKKEYDDDIRAWLLCDDGGASEDSPMICCDCIDEAFPNKKVYKIRIR